MTERMKVDGWLNFAAAARLVHRPQLVTLAPHGAVFFEEHWLATRSVKASLLEEGRTVIGQHNMARLAGLTDVDRDGASVWIEVGHRKSNEFAIAGTCFERSTNEISKDGVASIQQTLTFGNCEIAHASGISSLEWLDLPPFLIRRRFAFAPSEVERSL
jgi:hypothetical protein